MKDKTWKGKPFKKLSYGKSKNAGRNYSGSITAYHRGGGSKRLFRRIDFQRNLLTTGLVERIEHDPNRSSRIALIRWLSVPPAYACDEDKTILKNKSKESSNFGTLNPEAKRLESPCAATGSSECASALTQNELTQNDLLLNMRSDGSVLLRQRLMSSIKALPRGYGFFSYILACDKLKPGCKIYNFHLNDHSDRVGNSILNSKNKIPPMFSTIEVSQSVDNEVDPIPKIYREEDVGNNGILAKLPIGSILHNIEWSPGQGGRIARAAGTYAQLVRPLENVQKCIIRLPSGRKVLLNSQNRATLGALASKASKDRKFYKAGQNRWLGRLPVVRGVAMNPVDHPHGGGEGRTSGGRPSVSPWGKSSKGARRRANSQKRLIRPLSGTALSPTGLFAFGVN